MNELEARKKRALKKSYALVIVERGDDLHDQIGTKLIVTNGVK